jgi:hypothetical protein
MEVKKEVQSPNVCYGALEWQVSDSMSSLRRSGGRSKVGTIAGRCVCVRACCDAMQAACPSVCPALASWAAAGGGATGSRLEGR